LIADTLMAEILWLLRSPSCTLGPWSIESGSSMDERPYFNQQVPTHFAEARRTSHRSAAQVL